MKTREVLPRMTPTRRAWLEQVEKDVRSRHVARSHTTYDCLRLGWVERMIATGGEVMPDHEFEARFPPGSDERMAAYEDWNPVGYTLTAAGREALRLARREDVGL